MFNTHRINNHQGLFAPRSTTTLIEPPKPESQYEEEYYEPVPIVPIKKKSRFLPGERLLRKLNKDQEKNQEKNNLVGYGKKHRSNNLDSHTRITSDVDLKRLQKAMANIINDF